MKPRKSPLENAICSYARGARSPHPAGRVPHVAVGLLVAACLAPLAATGCSPDGGNQVQPPVVLGMTSSTPFYYSDENVTLYEVQAKVPLPVREPTDAEKAALGSQDPYPRAPFLLAKDIQVEVRFTISNLDDEDLSVELLLDPWNEFVHYEPGVTIVNDEETEPNTSGYDKFMVVPAKSRVEGTITHDDTNELAIDLATAMDIVKNPPGMDATEGASTLMNHAFDLQNRSNDGDPLIAPYVPPVIAGLTGFDLGLRTYAQANVAVEITVDATDLNGHRFVQSSSDTQMSRPGTALSPPGARQAN